MNTLSHTQPNLRHSSSSSSPLSFRQFTAFLPRRRQPQSIHAPKHRATHASISVPPFNNSAPELGKEQPTSPANYPPALTPLNFLERAALIYGDCPSIIYNGITRTWAETRIRCLKLASSIAALGISRGDVVSVVAPNIPAMCELHFAVPMAAAVLNAISLRLNANAVSNLLRHGDSKLVFVDSESASLVREAVSLLRPPHHRPILVLIGDDGCDERSSFDLDYESMVENGDAAFEWVRPRSEWDPMVLNYTSGTTAAPKGVVHSHRSAFLQSLNMLFEWGVPQRPVYLWTLPMFHCNGWNLAWGMAAVGGANVCLRRVDAPSVYGAVEEHGVTHMCGAPVVLNMLSNYSGSGRKALSAPVHVMTAGAPPPAAVLGRAESLGFITSHGYGLTETGGPVVMCTWKPEWDQLAGSERARLKARQGVGSICSADVDVVEPNSGESVAHDGLTRGEVVLRGGTLMSGYLNDPEGTSRCMRENGWFWTGDIGVIHEDGYLEVKDRSKDIIICGGENVSSVEVEAVLYTHPAVHEAAVVARPDRYWGETPCAFVSLKEEAAEKTSEKEIRKFCKERLPLFMVPRMVVFKTELPKTSTGKIQKYLLRDMAKDF
ncbi:2-methylpropanoate--CoA ligase CCL4-like [Salvia miltiorrhiza]|uniref:2-methylpropanoate--CoA ligase CCL4-like n=1 Tax=Salvia miltiorrhiza TaxID=226208 RepID=UPI0025ACAB0E|nr:2-methylpropanoate--CoA ligase CCL4-like [Salvia miltiorrhiza]